MGLPPCCCDSSFDNWLAPAGVPTRSDTLASIVGIVAPAAFCAALLSMPRKDAICAMTSGVSSWVTIELRLTAMAISPLRCPMSRFDWPPICEFDGTVVDGSRRRPIAEVEYALIVGFFDLDQRDRSGSIVAGFRGQSWPLLRPRSSAGARARGAVDGCVNYPCAAREAFAHEPIHHQLGLNLKLG